MSRTIGNGIDVPKFSRAATHAPSAKIAIWPSETRPTRPMRRLSPSATTAEMPDAVKTSIQYRLNSGGRANTRTASRPATTPMLTRVARSRVASEAIVAGLLDAPARRGRRLRAGQVEERDGGQDERRHVAVLRDRQDRRDHGRDEADDQPGDQRDDERPQPRDDRRGEGRDH